MKSQPEIEFLNTLNDFGIKLGLDKIRYLLKHFGNPHLSYPSVLIAGTNGKGSVASTLANILTRGGYKTGLYTSPHLISIGERIRIDGIEISEQELSFKIKQLQRILTDQPYHLYPTFFEALTAIAFSYFLDKKIDVLVCEVGMGGRFDATNVLSSSLEVITRIGCDHMQYLGNTYEEIANEKAGIIKEGTSVVSARQRVPAMEVIRRKAREKRAKLYCEGEDFITRRTSFSPEGQVFNFYGKNTALHNIKTPLKGRYQIGNMSLAVQSASLLKGMGFVLPSEAIYKGIETTFWPCRFQILQKTPVVVIDGAHNPDGMKTLLDTIGELYPDKKFSFLMGVLRDKDWKKMLSLILSSRKVEGFVFTTPDSERALSPDVLAEFVLKKQKGCSVKVIKNPSQALRYVKGTKGNWCICGSLYLCGGIIGKYAVNCVDSKVSSRE
ncbi:MAG: bifunctional folylpolyglutamate synthase/dihydrofolate synthase [Candidatus Ratteibacteria bacterium]|nr:bifunctional folylpolyglutamate synthase/dihydrofolate synthase [Candidatus Ratteibacteria bacterium]